MPINPAIKYVVPAKAGTQGCGQWIPAFAGMTTCLFACHVHKFWTFLALILAAAQAGAVDTPASQLAGWAREAGTPVTAFSAARGEALFRGKHVNSGGEEVGCFSCHTSDPRNPGRTRAGKAVEPLAPAMTPARFTDAAKTEKWFARNCGDVLGRPCTAEEKGDFLTWLMSIK